MGKARKQSPPSHSFWGMRFNSGFENRYSHVLFKLKRIFLVVQGLNLMSNRGHINWTNVFHAVPHSTRMFRSVAIEWIFWWVECVSVTCDCDALLSLNVDQNLVHWELAYDSSLGRHSSIKFWFTPTARYFCMPLFLRPLHPPLVVSSSTISTGASRRGEVHFFSGNFRETFPLTMHSPFGYIVRLFLTFGRLWIRVDELLYTFLWVPPKVVQWKRLEPHLRSGVWQWTFQDPGFRWK